MTNDYAKASSLLTDVIAVKAQDAALYYPLALSLLKDGKLEAANRVIEQMVAVGGNSPQLHILFSQAHYERGEVDKALAELKTRAHARREGAAGPFLHGPDSPEGRKVSGGCA